MTRTLFAFAVLISFASPIAVRGAQAPPATIVVTGTGQASGPVTGAAIMAIVQGEHLDAGPLKAALEKVGVTGFLPDSSIPNATSPVVGARGRMPSAQRRDIDAAIGAVDDYVKMHPGAKLVQLTFFGLAADCATIANRARAAALGNAHTQVVQIAQTTGVRVGNVASVVEPRACPMPGPLGGTYAIDPQTLLMTVPVQEVVTYANETRTDTNDVAVQLATATVRSDLTIELGPDGHEYLQAFRASDPQVANTKQYPMPELAKRAIDGQRGIVVFDRSPTESKPLRVFSLGAAISLATGDWRPTPADQSRTVPHMPAGDHVVRASPSLAVLPLAVRRALDALMKKDGIAEPTIVVVLFMPPSGSADRYLLIPNVPRSKFRTEADWTTELNRLAWFLPPTFDWIRPPEDRHTFTALFNHVKPLVSGPS